MGARLAYNRVKGRPHYYSSKKEEYAIIKFSLDADLSSLFTWNTKQVFVYVTADWTSAKKGGDGSGGGEPQTNSAVIWDAIITNPSADHLTNLGPIALKKLVRSSEGKSIDPSRYVRVFFLSPFLFVSYCLHMIFGAQFKADMSLFSKHPPYRGVLSLKNQKPKYQITHPSSKIAETGDVTLRVHYNVQPWVGALTWNQDRDYGLWKSMASAVSRTFKLPALKVKGAKADDKSGKAKKAGKA